MTTPRTISRLEADALRLLRALLGHLPARQVQAILHRQVTAKPTVSQSAAHLLKDTLRKGLVRFLVHAGGWRTDRFLIDGTPQAGHPWQRYAGEDRKLAFSGNPLAFLLWLAAERPNEARTAWISTGAITLADQLVFLLAADALQEYPDEWFALRRSTPFAANPFVWLARPWSLDAESAVPDFAPLFAPPGPAILECLQPWLAELWLAADRSLAHQTDWNRLRHHGEQAGKALTAFLAAAETRRDLAKFVLSAISPRLTTAATLQHWARSLPDDAPLKLADRLAAKRAALSMIQQIETLARWNREARSVAFFDDGYAASQHWKAEYEAASGDELLAKWQRLKAKLDPLSAP